MRILLLLKILRLKGCHCKGKGKGKAKSSQPQDPDYPAWNVKVKAVHLPHATIPIGNSEEGRAFGLNELSDLKRAIAESLESERIRKAQEEEELQQILAQIDGQQMNEMWAKANEEFEENRERKRGTKDTNFKTQSLMHSTTFVLSFFIHI